MQALGACMHYSHNIPLHTHAQPMEFILTKAEPTCCQRATRMLSACRSVRRFLWVSVGLLYGLVRVSRFVSIPRSFPYTYATTTLSCAIFTIFTLTLSSRTLAISLPSRLAPCYHSHLKVPTTAGLVFLGWIVEYYDIFLISCLFEKGMRRSSYEGSWQGQQLGDWSSSSVHRHPLLKRLAIDSYILSSFGAHSNQSPR